MDFLCRALGLVFLGLVSTAVASVRLGVLQPSPERAADYREAGVGLVVLAAAWDRFQPEAHLIDEAYVARLRSEADTYRAAGLRLVLDLGVQYPPAWILGQPDARFRNQHGDAYVDATPGKNIANLVFNGLIRERWRDYVAALFRRLGADWDGVRLGGGWYGELNYPPSVFARNVNCYWAYDPVAQGERPGLPDGMRPCPVPGWKPGAASPDHASARLFLEWYLESLRHYHDWQILAMRLHYDGPLMMLYPSWGIRPGQIDAAVAGALAGDTPAERNGEIQRGFDFARFIDGIRDPQVWVQSTWADSDPAWSDDASGDPGRWSPAGFLAHLARGRVPPLRVAAENTGGGGPPALELSARRVRGLNLDAFFWAFGPDLFDGRPPELEDLRRAFAR